ncbi:hypothetical protein PG990_006183 [Apiospora arundinis]|uniref:Uncharacterized protein n=1 Tax=Apiospora arundinis TaxID=335852 RepID=A0ABR2J9H0_9PEZI
MGNHSNKKPSSSKQGKSKDPQSTQGSYSSTDDWVGAQSTGGPWDGVYTIDTDQWNTPGYGGYQYTDSVAPDQGSVKQKKSTGKHKSSGKK